jgi:hypothetical protein
MCNHQNGTPYDDVYKTLLNDCTNLIIPVVNEMFDENYTGNETVEFLPNEHFINLQDNNTKEKITDSCFRISGQKKKYHIECQSTTDSSMSIRMFEYDSQIALDDGEVTKGRLCVTFPHSGVLYLRHNRNTPDAMNVEINTPGGSISYQIPVLKAQQYTIDQIFEKNLLFLIPFYIFGYEKELPEYENDKEKLRMLQQEFAGIRERLEALCEMRRINEYEKYTILEMTKKVIENIAAKYAKVRRGVTAVMGGKVLEHEAKTILQRGIQQGKQEGLQEGIQRGKQEGLQEGIQRGKQEGLQQGKQEGTISAYIGLVRDGLLSLTEAAVRLGMSEEELKKHI